MISRQGANVQKIIDRLYKSAKSKKTILMVLSCVVVFITTYALILPAITLEQDEAAKQGGIDVPAQSVSDTDKGYEITADFDKAGLPEDVELSAEEITGSDQDYEVLYEDALQAVREDSGNKTSDLAFAKFYDISLYSDGERIEPDGPVDVTISYDKAPKASDADKVRIVHFALDEETGEVVPEVLDSKRVEAEVKGGKLTETTFEATSFSIYAIVYTVDFEYDVDGKKYTYSIEGGSKINLADLLLQLQVIKDDPDTEVDEVQLFMDDIDKVEFSSPKLVRVEQEDSDWTLTSLKPFDSTETLTVTMKNGDMFTVKVTDAQEISDSSADAIDVNKSYLICFEADGTYYLLKNNGSVDSSHTPDTFENLNSTYCWTFNYVFEEKDLDETMTYVYYLIRPIDNKTKTIALNAEGEDLVQRSNNNVAVIPAEGGGFNLIGYNNVKLNFENGAFSAKELPEGNNGITVHIYEMDSLPTYSYTARSADENRGSVAISGGMQKTETLDDSTVVHYYEAESNSDKMNAGTITATPANHGDSQGHNKWIFDHWKQDGVALDRDQYPETIGTNTLPIPFNGSNLVAYFKQNPDYNVPDNEKEPSSIENLENWLNELAENHVPLDEEATTKTAEVYDYENRIYRVDIESKSNFKTFKGDVDMAFCMDVSNSMYFPSKLVEHTDLQIYKINNGGWGWTNQNWLDTSRGWNNPYYLVADESNTATVFKIYYQDGNWKAQDASRQSEDDRSFRIGDDFTTNWAGSGTHPFNAGDDDNTTYTIYNAGDDGRNRFYYLNQAFSGATTDLTTIKDILEVAGDESPDVKVAYNTFNLNLGTQRQDFESVSPITGLDLSNSHGGGTRPDQAFIDAQTFDWQGDDRYVILITDGAPQGQRSGETNNNFDRISQAVKDEAQFLKDYGGVKFITIGLSMDKVPHGKKLLYDLADNDKDGNKMFFMAENASDLPNILRQVTKTIMDDAIVLADVTDTVGEAFYPVDKNTGMPLQPGDMIDLEGRLTTDIDNAAGIVQDDGMTIQWTNQAVDSKIGWHGTIYVKAKEDLLGGNAMKTNGDASIDATKYRMGEKEYTFDESLLGDKLKSLEIDFESPRVNVNELSFPSESTEWTVYLGTEVDPKKQLKKMYEDILVSEVINEDGSLQYPLEPNSISDKRSGSGTAKTFQLASLILDLIKADDDLAAQFVRDGELNWDAFLTEIMKAGGFTLPYHLYGVEGDDSTIVIKLTKDVLEDEEDDLVNASPHSTTVVNSGNTPAEKYVLTVQYNPDYNHVLPAGQGGHGHYNYNTGSHGAMYQGHAAGRETSTNTHVVNVYKKTIDILKTDENDTALQGATFKLYRKDNDHGSAIEGLSGKYTEVATATSGADGIAHLDSTDEDILVGGVTYYLIETTPPQGYNKADTVWTVEVQADKSGTYTNLDDEVIHTKKYPFNWDQGARIVVDGQPVTVITKGEGENQTVTVNDGSFVSNGDAISYRYPVVNRADNISLTVSKTWEDAGIKPDSVSFKIYRVSEKGHVWTNGTVVPCTCTEDGVREYTCSDCDKTETYVIDKTGHTPATAHRENEIEPTCDSPGSYDMVVRCKVCDAIISSEHVEIPATEHTWVNQQIATSDPEHYCYDTIDVCSVCGEVNEEAREHHDHDWGDWETTTPAQPGVAGVETRVCGHDSSHIETREIAPLPLEHTVSIYFRYTGNGSGGTDYPGQIRDITSRSGTGVGDMTIQWDWNQWTEVQPFDVDGLQGSTYSTYSTTDGRDYSRRYENGRWVERGKRQTLTISNITKDLVIYITIRNGGYDGTNNGLIYQPTFAGLPATVNSASAPKRSLKSIAKGLLNSLFDGDGKSGQASLRGAGTSMTSEELSEYLSSLKNKTDASCRENEDHLYKEEVDTYTIKADDNWTLPINDLPKYNEYGKEYAYYVVEEDSTGAYTITYLGQTNGLHDGDAATINNKQKPGSLKISKSVAVTEGSAADLADGTYTFEIWNADGTSQITKKADGSTDIGTLQITVTDGVANPATLTVDGLNAGTYVLKETASTNTGTMIDTSVSGYDSSLGGIAVTVSPNDIEGVQTAAFTNKYETTSVTVKKVWDDNDSSDRPESLTVTLLADGEPTDKTVTLSEQNHWEDSIDNLPKYKEGVEIDYHWLEGSMPDGYFLTDISKDGAVTTLTNKLLKYDLKTSYTGVKTWDDDGNKYSTRPHELTVTLYADEEPLSIEPVWNYDAGTNLWAYTFENLPVFTEDGTLIHYTAQETVPGGYIKSDESQTPTTGQFGTVTYENGRERVTPDNQIVWELGSLIDLSFVAIKPTANGDVVVWTHRAPVPSEKTAITNAIRGGALPGCQNRNIVFYSGTGDVHTPHGNVHVTYDHEHLSVTLDFGSTDVWSQFIVGQFNKNDSSSYNIGTTAFTNKLETTDLSGSKTWAIEGEDIPADPILTLTRTVTTDDGEGNTTTSAPETVTVTVNGNPVHLQPVWTGTGKEKTFTYAGLPKYDQNGNEYTYSVAEASFVIGTGEDAVTYTAVKAADGTYTVTADKEGADPYVVTQEGNAIVNGPLGTTIEIIKVEEGHKDSSHTLSGAQFQLTRVNEDNDNDYNGPGAYQSEIQTVDSETGRVFFSGLKPGRYRLDEITPPEGYILLETPWFLRVNAKGEAALEADYSLASVNEDGENSFYIENTPGPVLPESGGPGTTWIYLIGSLLLIGCGIALVTRRRMRI